MRHSKIKKLVSEYIDGELKNNIALVEEHLKSCEECSYLVKVHELVRESLKENTIEVSPYLFTRIQAQLSEVRSKAEFWAYVAGLAHKIVFALVLLLFILIGIEVMSSKTSLKIDEVILSEMLSVQKVISSSDSPTKDEVLELTLSNGEKK